LIVNVDKSSRPSNISNVRDFKHNEARRFEAGSFRERLAFQRLTKAVAVMDQSPSRSWHHPEISGTIVEFNFGDLGQVS
jgi:hypothetical protein